MRDKPADCVIRRWSYGLRFDNFHSLRRPLTHARTVDALRQRLQRLDTCNGSRLGAAYHQKLLGNDSFIALAALKSGPLVGGLAACKLIKFEKERSERYNIYDLALDEFHRRQDIVPR